MQINSIIKIIKTNTNFSLEYSSLKKKINSKFKKK